MILIFLILIALIVYAATSNRQAYYQQGPTYIEPGVVVVDDTPLIAGMVAADIASDIAFGAAESAMMSNQGQYIDQGQYMDSQDSDFGGGGDFLGGDAGFDSSSGGFDSGGGDF